MTKEYEVDIFDLLRVTARRWRTVLATVLAFMAAATLFVLVTPKTYRCQSTIAIPQEPNQWIKVSEVREIVTAAREKLLAGVDSANLPPRLVSKISSIRIVDIPDVETFFRLEVKAVGEPALAESVSHYLFGYLSSYPAIQYRRESMITGLDSAIRYSERILESMSGGRVKTGIQADGSRPNDIRLDMVSLHNKLVEYRVKKAGLRNFEYISGPRLDPSPVSPKAWVIISIAGLTGLLIGLMLALALDYRGFGPDGR